MNRITQHALAWIAALALAACSSSGKPQPQALGPNPGLLAVQQAWSVRLAAPLAAGADIRVQDDSIILAGRDGSVTTLDARSGAQRARFIVPQAISAAIGSDGQRLAVATQDNHIAVYSAQGRLAWRRTLPAAAYTAPLVAGERVFVLSADRTLSAFDAADGYPLWSVPHPGEALVLRQGGVLLALGNTLLAGLSARLSAIDPDSGALRWQAPIASPRGTNDVERLADLVGPASRVGSSVCTRAFAASVGCVDGTSARVVWTQAFKGAQGIDGNAHAVFAADAQGTVQAWQRSDGARLWSSEQLRQRQLTAPLLWGDDVLVLGDDSGMLHFLSTRDGQALARLAIDSSGVERTALQGDTLIVASRNGTVYGLRRDSRKL